MSRLYLVTYEDGSQGTLNLSDAAFGEGTSLHGPIATIRVAPQEPQDLDPEGFPHHTRLSRSLTGTPIYGTGRMREAS
jgi:hypothetical protein